MCSPARLKVGLRAEAYAFLSAMRLGRGLAFCKHGIEVRHTKVCTTGAEENERLFHLVHEKWAAIYHFS